MQSIPELHDTILCSNPEWESSSLSIQLRMYISPFINIIRLMCSYSNYFALVSAFKVVSRTSKLALSL